MVRFASFGEGGDKEEEEEEEVVYGEKTRKMRVVKTVPPISRLSLSRKNDKSDSQTRKGEKGGKSAPGTGAARATKRSLATCAPTLSDEDARVHFLVVLRRRMGRGPPGSFLSCPLTFPTKPPRPSADALFFVGTVSLSPLPNAQNQPAPHDQNPLASSRNSGSGNVKATPPTDRRCTHR